MARRSHNPVHRPAARGRGDCTTAQTAATASDVDLGWPAGATGPITDTELTAIGETIGRPVPA